MSVSTLLLPARYKKIGFLILIPFAAFGIFLQIYDFSFDFLAVKDAHRKAFDDTNENWTNELVLAGLIVGLMMVAFSRQKHEDEFIQTLRLESLQWAVLVNYLLLFVANLTVFGFGFINVMIYNMLTILIIFIVRFHFVLRKNNAVIPE